MEAFKTGYSQLNDEQRQAVDCIDGPLVVVAGPGTGKTQLLALRVANILQKTDTAAGSILCLTFTESAQLTMQQRLTDFIGDAAYQVNVHTFHSFASNVLTDHAELFDNFIATTVADELTSFEILRHIFEELPRQHPLSAFDGESYVHLASTQRVISNLKTAGLLPEQLREILQRDQAWLQAVAPQLHDLEATIKPRLRAAHIPAYESFAEQLKDGTDKALHGFSPLSLIAKQELDTALQACRDQNNSTKPLTAWRTRWIQTTATGAVFKDSIRIEKLLSVASIYEAYQAALGNKHLRDFDDLILQVIARIEDDADLKADLQERYQYILVDEYQDTSGAQQQLINVLGDNDFNEGQPNLMVVGDDDQAIYGFQGATPAYIRQFEQRWHNVEHVTLTSNYRSTPNILRFADSLIAQADYRTLLTTARKTLQPHKEAGAAVKLLTYQHNVDQYWGVVDLIKKHVSSGCPASDIAVLAPRHRHLQAIVPYLLSAGIAIEYERRDDVLQRQHIRELLHVASTVQALADNDLTLANSQLPELLSFAFWGLDTQFLWRTQLDIREAGTDWLSHLTQHDGELASIGNFLLEAARLARTDPLDSLLDALIGNTPVQGYTSPFKSYYFSNEQLTQNPATFVTLLSGLNTLRDRIAKWAGERQLVLSDLISFCKLIAQAKQTVQDTHPISLSGDSVHVMTAHRAKGQEFSVVILLDCDETHWAKDKGKSSTISLPANLPIEPEPDEADEKLRRLYVAVTRAADQLIITRAEKTNDGKTQLPLHWLSHADVSQQFEDETITSPASASQLIEGLQLDWHQQQAAALRASLSLRQVLAPRLSTYHLSPSHLNTFLNAQYGGPSVWLVNQLLGFPQPASPDSAYGTAIHRALELLHKRVNDGGEIEVRHVLADFKIALDKQPLPSATLAKLAERGKTALEAYLAARKDSFIPGQLAEFDVTPNQVVIGNARLRGKIDLITVDAKKKTLVVTDYKTGRSFADWHPSDPSHRHKLRGYRRQLIFYKLLLEHSRAYQGYTVTTGQLAFVEPDTEGAIHCILTDFPDNEVEEVKALISAVWERMMTLELPELHATTVAASRALETSLLQTELPLK